MECKMIYLTLLQNLDPKLIYDTNQLFSKEVLHYDKFDTNRKVLSKSLNISRHKNIKILQFYFQFLLCRPVLKSNKCWHPNQRFAIIL